MKQQIEKIQPDDWHKAVLHDDGLQKERDTLLAERKEQLVKNVFDSSDKKLMENHGFNDFIELLTAYEKLLAEREQMMKQGPYPLEDVLIHCGYLTHDQVMDISEQIGTVYAKPVPQDQSTDLRR